MQKLLLALCALLAAVGTLQAETIVMDPVVVTATRTSTPLSELGSAVTVVTSEDIEEKQQTRVVEVLRNIPGVNIVQSGNTGGTVSIYLRGTDTRHTLVLIDGVEYRDVAGFGGADIANLTTENIERIEVVRGAQSVLYGSDAIGGVINIITKKGTRAPEGYASVEKGSYQTNIFKAGIASGTDLADVNFSVSNIDTQGFSSADEDNGNTETDGYTDTTASLNIGIRPSDIVAWRVSLRSTEASYDYDGSTYDATAGRYVLIDADNTQDVSEQTGRIEGTFTLLDGRWIMTVGSAITNSERTYDEETSDSEYHGRLTKFDLQNTVLINDQNTLTLGAETEKEEFDYYYDDFVVDYYDDSADGKARTNAVYVQDQLTFGSFSTTLGLRYDDHDEFGGKTTWRVAPTYNFKATGTRIKGSVGTGFKAPTLFQLYSSYGNRDLEAEKSFGWDAGIEQELLDSSLILSVSYFYNDVDDYIDYYFNPVTYDFSYQNIKKLKTKGIESSAVWFACDYFNLKLAYTYTDSEDADGERLARRPLHKASVDMILYPLDNVDVTLTTTYTSDREDGADTLDNYTLVNLAASWQVIENLTLFGRIDNLFDEDYQEVTDYGTAGLSGYLGLKASF